MFNLCECIKGKHIRVIIGLINNKNRRINDKINYLWAIVSTVQSLNSVRMVFWAKKKKMHLEYNLKKKNLEHDSIQVNRSEVISNIHNLNSNDIFATSLPFTGIEIVVLVLKNYSHLNQIVCF